MVKTKTPPKSETREVPDRACRLLFETGLELQRSPEAEVAGGKRHRFKMHANTGKVILNHWWWGNLAINMAGVQVNSKRLPILKDHDPEQRVGFTDAEPEISDDGIFLEGPILKSSAVAEQILEESDDGFPWQASVRLTPTKLRDLAPNEVATVNGREVAGPGTIFEESVLREGSFTAVGADDETSAQAFADGKKVVVQITNPPQGDEEMSKTDKTVELDASAVRAYLEGNRDEFSDLFDQVSGDAEKAERDRVNAILAAAHPSQHELAHQLIKDGIPIADAVLKINEDLRKKYDEKPAGTQKKHDPVDKFMGTGDESLSAPEPENKKTDFSDLPEGKEKFKQEWEANHNKCQDVFSGEAAYIAYRMNVGPFTGEEA